MKKLGRHFWEADGPMEYGGREEHCACGAKSWVYPNGSRHIYDERGKKIRREHGQKPPACTVNHGAKIKPKTFIFSKKMREAI